MNDEISNARNAEPALSVFWAFDALSVDIQAALGRRFVGRPRMTRYTNKVVRQFDFGPAASLPLEERFETCIERARALAETSGYQRISDFPCVPGGATDGELRAFAAEFPLGALPAEYLAFLSSCRYLKLDDGLEIGGLAHNGL